MNAPMVALIEVGLIFLLGFTVGYLVRANVSHRRHQRARALRDMSDSVHHAHGSSGNVLSLLLARLRASLIR